MDDLILTTVFDDRIEILLPEEKCSDGVLSRCDCCGRPAPMDDDCFGICPDCLAP
jgi:hypothetical protein